MKIKILQPLQNLASELTLTLLSMYEDNSGNIALAKWIQNFVLYYGLTLESENDTYFKSLLWMLEGISLSDDTYKSKVIELLEKCIALLTNTKLIGVVVAPGKK